MTNIFLLEYVTFPAFRLNVFLNVLMVSLNILDVNMLWTPCVKVGYWFLSTDTAVYVLLIASY